MEEPKYTSTDIKEALLKLAGSYVADYPHISHAKERLGIEKGRYKTMNTVEAMMIVLYFMNISQGIEGGLIVEYQEGVRHELSEGGRAARFLQLDLSFGEILISYKLGPYYSALERTLEERLARE